MKQHSWEVLEIIGNQNSPIMLKAKCKTCSCTLWYFGGSLSTTVYDPGTDEPPPCKEPALNPS